MATGEDVVGLFVDWRAATGRDPASPAGETELEVFFAQVPGSVATLRHRRRVLEVAALAVPAPVEPPEGAGELPGRVGAMLAAIPVGGWPVGLVGRRDAALVALSRVGRLRRPALRQLVVGGPLPVLPVSSGSGAGCPACALSRWQRTVLVAAGAGWGEIRNQLAEMPASPPPPDAAHDCVSPLPAMPRQARPVPFLSGIDRYGWVDEDRPLSARAISTVLSARARGGDHQDSVAPATGTTTRVASPTWQEAIDLRRDAAARLDEIDRTLERLGV